MFNRNVSFVSFYKKQAQWRKVFKQTLKNSIIKSNKFSKIVDNLEQTKISIENNIKMLTLGERLQKVVSKKQI